MGRALAYPWLSRFRHMKTFTDSHSAQRIELLASSNVCSDKRLFTSKGREIVAVVGVGSVRGVSRENCLLNESH